MKESIPEIYPADVKPELESNQDQQYREFLEKNPELISLIEKYLSDLRKEKISNPVQIKKAKEELFKKIVYDFLSNRYEKKPHSKLTINPSDREHFIRAYNEVSAKFHLGKVSRVPRSFISKERAAQQYSNVHKPFMPRFDAKDRRPPFPNEEDAEQKIFYA